MSGSGPTVFGIFDLQQKAEKLIDTLKHQTTVSRLY